MKNFIRLSIFILLASTGCRDHTSHVPERPVDVTNLPLCQTLYQNILGLFPESRNATTRYPWFFDPRPNHRIVLTAESDVYVSFIGEGAGRSNTLGWYAYKADRTPSERPEVRSQVIFPHISNSVLVTGDTRKIGRFPAGTVIGFYLVVGGWDANQGIINFSRPTIYSDAVLNDGQAQQSILFSETTCDDIVVGFEDLKFSSSDKDFNDILFKVTDNNEQKTSTAFDLTAIPRL